ncbi:hypothetical protein [Amycolatopsis aidingensis]|uniref:hypothetical protein n=1 Tax=Amycolatopsis aidingensis TaxID=2842453 RepID=UPI001C0D7C7E|nr:hypothetical protein [Amycolatopsis aidingensis]
MDKVGRRWAIAAMAWGTLYVASKVHHALTGRLGVTGGPAVEPAAYASYRPGGVALAQWGNAGIGVLGVALVALPLLPVAQRLRRWVLLLPLCAFALMALGGGLVMLIRALVTDVGGAAFGAYCLVWSALIAMTARAVANRRLPRSPSSLPAT